MGIEYSAKIVVGLPVHAFENRDEIEELDLEVVAPYYDGDDDGVAGVIVLQSGDYNRREVDTDSLMDKIEAASGKFLALTGKIGIVYLSTCGYY